jgi:hypothetical protein
MKIIAEKPESQMVLEYIDEKYGRIIDFKKNLVWPKMLILSILARGYWKEYSEPIEFTPPDSFSQLLIDNAIKNLDEKSTSLKVKGLMANRLRNEIKKI